nr:AMP-binding protein [Mycolicibacterium insubricum]
MASQPTVTVAELVRRRADDDNIGLVYGTQSWSWREVVAEAAARAAWLKATLDPDRPPHFGVLLPNVPEYVFEILGAALAGAVWSGSTRPAAAPSWNATSSTPDASSCSPTPDTPTSSSTRC